MSHASRFWAKVERLTDDECWVFKAFTDRHGYGRFSIGEKNMSAQRAAWLLTHGEIPNGLHVLHRCDNPPCCNPAHLFLGTHADNMRDAASKKRMRSVPKKGAESAKRQMTHCGHGHLYDDANTGWSKAGHRVCRQCAREATAAYRESRRTTPRLGMHYNAAKTHCSNGHTFDDANTYWYRGWRQCRTCSNARRRVHHA